MNQPTLRAIPAPTVAHNSSPCTFGVTSHRHNNFDTIRALAAVSVLVSHSFQFAYGFGSHQPLDTLSHGQTNLGSLAVLVFFVISGYLVTQSFDRTPDAVSFLRARALRIFPGLFVVLLLSALVLGPAMTSLPLGRYFAHPGTAAYVPINMTLVLMRYPLPGVFADHPGGEAVNGALWTLQGKRMRCVFCQPGSEYHSSLRNGRRPFRNDELHQTTSWRNLPTCVAPAGP